MTRDHHVFVIAEAGVNHNGSLELALRLVDEAARSGADAVKFQTFKSELLVTPDARKADYQVAATGGADGQLEMLRRLELSAESHAALAKRCGELGIAFMSTAFDMESLRFLAQFEMPAIKIGSGDVTAAPLVLEAAKAGKPLIMSTGMCTLSEIEEALGVIAFGLTGADRAPSRLAFADAYASEEGRKLLAERVTLLHCVTEYPAPLAETNLRAMDVLRERFGLRVGYSDHTIGTSAAFAAAARGACIVEKHFTLDRSLPGPDHAASLEPAELVTMVKGIREIEVALGSRRKEPTASELRNRPAARRSLVAAAAIRRGQAFTQANLAVKRPGSGISPLLFWEMLGREAARDYRAGEMIEP